MASRIIQWNPTGGSFYITDKEAFVELLPHYFKTKNFNSFVRQLNMYGFHKVKGAHEQEFKHAFFRNGHPEYLCYIKRRYAHGQGEAKVEHTDGDVSPSRYFDLRQQFGLVSERVEGATREIERLSEENTRLSCAYRQMTDGNQRSLQQTLLLLFSLLGPNNPELTREFGAYLTSVNISLSDIASVFDTVSIESLLEQNMLKRMFNVENCESIIEGLMGVLKTHMLGRKITDDAERIKQLLLKRAYDSINTCLVVPNATPRLSLSVMEDVVESCGPNSARRSLQGDDAHISS